MGTLSIQERFERFHQDNPQVYKMFIRFAFELRASGNSKGSAAMIFERLRWEAKTKHPDMKLLLNNNYRANYARLAMTNHPELVGFFVTRRQVVERRKKRK